MQYKYLPVNTANSRNEAMVTKCTQTLNSHEEVESFILGSA